MNKALRITTRVVVAATVVVFLLAAYVLLVGIPGPVAGLYLRKIENTQGVHIAVDQVRWTPWHRIAARDVRVSVPGGDTYIGFRKVVVSIGPAQEDDATPQTVRCRFEGARVGPATKGEQAREVVRLLEGDVFVEPGRRVRMSAEGMIGDQWRFSVNGILRLTTDKRPDVQGPVLGESISTLGDVTHQVLDALAAQREKGVFPDALNAHVMFDVDAGDPRRNHAWAFLEGGRVRVGNLSLARFSAAVQWTNGQLSVDSLKVQSSDPDILMQGVGSVSPGNREVAAQLRIEADPAALFAAGLLPTNQMHNVSPAGPLCVDLSLGPAPMGSTMGSILSNLTGRITCAAAEYRGARFEQLSAVFSRHGDELRISNATATLAGGGPARRVRADGLVMPDGAYRIHLQTDAEPQRLAALLPTNVAAVVASLTVNGNSRTEAALLRSASGQANMSVHALIHATDVARNGVAVDLLHASLAYSNATLLVEDLAIVRQDGRVTGRVGYDFDAQLLSLDVSSTFPPLQAARFVGPGLERILSSYRVEGPTTIEGKGIIGLKTNTTRDLRLHVKGERLGWRWFLADRAEIDVALSDDETVIDNVSALWCEGHIAGSLRFRRASGTNTAGRCSADLMLTGACLANVVEVYRELEDRKPYAGELSGQVTLSGQSGPDFLRTAAGSGRIAIEDGYILSLPLFGGLSRYMSLLRPGLGYANQRDLRSTFQIGDGALQTADTQLLGRIITIRGRGAYAFDNDLNFRVEVLFLKEGLTASVTRLLTSPLTKALEFSLTGTTKEPRWRPQNCPSRVLGFFREKLGSVAPVGKRQNRGAAPQSEPKAQQSPKEPESSLR